jgi:8-oxo-dGTP diphosphatase
MKKGQDYIGVTVSFFCHDGEGNYVLQKRSTNCRDEHGRWDCGGGGIELGDTIEQTLKKEISEEYGVEVTDYEFLGVRDVHREQKGAKTHWVSIDYRVQLDRTKVRNGEPHKFEEIGWFSLDALPEPLHSALPLALEDYREKLT